jgi:hypothetical protein
MGIAELCFFAKGGKNMKREKLFKLRPALALVCALGVVFPPATTQAGTISKTMKGGVYKITLKVLPAEYFSGPKATMVRDAGAEPVAVNGPEHPNHHLVAFVKEHGIPVEDATVSISYREVSPQKSGWTPLPVVRMYEAGKALKTTHYGNNVDLGRGKYEAQVTVNGSKPAVFHFALPG